MYFIQTIYTYLNVFQFEYDSLILEMKTHSKYFIIIAQNVLQLFTSVLYRSKLKYLDKGKRL